jgi:tetratricopeptide (TPR) repeat protein
MSERHLSREQIETFLDDALDLEETRAVQRHLFTCPQCEELMLSLLPGAEVPATAAAEGPPELADAPCGPEYGGALQRVLDRARDDFKGRESQLDRERAEAEELWRELEAAPADRRREMVWGSPRHQNWGLFEVLLERARHAVFDDPEHARSLLELALEVAARLDSGRYGAGAVEAAKARAWGYLGNALRILGDFREAERAFQAAEDHLSQSWLDPLDEALLLELQSSLRRGQRRFAEAADLLEQAIALYHEVNEPHLQGRATINQGLVLLYAGEVEGAMASLRSGLFLIEPSQEPRLVLVAQQNLIHCLNDLGRAAEAKALIDEVRPLWGQVGRRLDLVRLRWLEGKVAANLGHWREAETALLEARAAFLQDRMAYDVALVSLDLAAVYLRQGRPAEVGRLTDEMLVTFRALGIRREAIAVVLLLQEAVQAERATLALCEEVAAQLRQLDREGLQEPRRA